MIDTNSMYGNVAEEQDAFQLIQKRQAAAKAAEAKKAEAAKKLTAEEIVLPDFPKEYNPETALETM